MKSSKPLWYITIRDKKQGTNISKKYELVGDPTNQVERDLKERALDYFKLTHKSEGYVDTCMFVGYVAHVNEIIPIEDKSNLPPSKFENTNHKKLKYKKTR